MRADRLIAALMVLQARGKVTAAELAAELEVSERTARRDLDALAMSGVPLYSQSGRGGGWRLVGGARTDLTGLSSDESRALFLALSDGVERDPMLEAALRKLLVALPDRFRDDAVSAAAAIRVDPNGWGQIGPAADRPVAVNVLSRLVIEGRQGVIAYRRPVDDEPHDRIVHPLGLVTKRGVWYLVANTDRGLRTYRVDRISRVDELEDAVDRPDDFDLDEQWARIVTDVESWRLEVEVVVRVVPELVGPVKYVFGGSFTERSVLADGRVEATIGDRSPIALAARVAGFGAGVELVGPPAEVVAEMRRITAELAATWA